MPRALYSRLRQGLIDDPSECEISCDMITDPWFYCLAIPALLVTSISKGGFGAGLGVLAVPLMALRLPVPQVTAIMLPIICLMDVVSVLGYRKRWDKRILAITLPGALFGILLG